MAVVVGGGKLSNVADTEAGEVVDCRKPGCVEREAGLLEGNTNTDY